MWHLSPPESVCDTSHNNEGLADNVGLYEKTAKRHKWNFAGHWYGFEGQVVIITVSVTTLATD